MAGILVVSIALWLIKPVKCSSIIPTILKYTHLKHRPSYYYSRFASRRYFLLGKGWVRKVTVHL